MVVIRQLLFAAAFFLIPTLVVAQPQPVTKIEFTSFTRGFQKQTFISRDSIIQMSNKRGVVDLSKRTIDSLEWETLIVSLKDVRIEEINDLPAPSSRRTFDGAMHSTITIKMNDGSKYAHSFDDEYPHEKLYPLMQSIKVLIGENPHR